MSGRELVFFGLGWIFGLVVFRAALWWHER